MEIIMCFLIIAILVLIFLYFRKQRLDTTELTNYQTLLSQTKIDLNNTKQEEEDARQNYYNLIEQYKNKQQQNQRDLDNFFIQQKQFRQSELNTEFEQKERAAEENLRLKLLDKQRYYQSQIDNAENHMNDIIAAAKANEQAIVTEVEFQQQRFESLLAPIQQYEKEKQDKLFYTIQIQEEYKNDIDFLLTIVAQKVQHPDVINKLVWSEYVKPNLDNTFKRIEIKPEPGIYKVTNINSNKAYIGKSTDVKKRLSDHFKASIGIGTIAHQSVHDAIRAEGFWNWQIEIITYCDKDKLSELEKYYIDFFKTQNYGYNRKEGG